MSSPARPTGTKRRAQGSPSQHYMNERSDPTSNGVHLSHGEDDFELYSSRSRRHYREMARVHADDERRFHDFLDDQNATQKRKHNDALSKAMEEHEQVRQAAEIARQRVELQIQQERQRRAAEQQRKLDEECRRAIEQEQREQERRLDEAKRLELQRREILRREQEAEAQRRESERQQRQQRQQQALAEKREREAEAEAARVAEERRIREEATAGEAEAKRQEQARQQQQQQQQQQLTNGVAPSSIPSAKPAASVPVAQAQVNGAAVQAATAKGVASDRQARDTIHQRYLDLNRKLHEFRESFDKLRSGWDKASRNKFLDWKGAIRKGIAQVDKSDPVQNRNAKEKVKAAILEAQRTVPEPKVDVREYVVGFPVPAGEDASGPAILLYMLSLFAKQCMLAFVANATDQERANPLGILIVQIFAMPDFQLFGRIPLIDILWAKYHVDCPILFGIWGSETTVEGKKRLGWQTDDDRSPYSNAFKQMSQPGSKIPWSSSDRHFDRLRGLANGFASITLRNFSKAKISNPAPNRLYWEALARLSNCPANEITLSLMVVLKNLVDGHIPRFISIYGHAAIVALRCALVDFPRRIETTMGGKNVPSQLKAVQAMPFTLKKGLRLSL
ncbi:GLE1-domain-containing protein [Polychaeton citri CBS 116435]|uniref:mRNA export factor GLE1 n=1 Tax=Polychaeton citri CBS 116435 TaxID=1314669 RepID=A0A9P4UR87_9PEZI|nr:GLE1-domain-containing protein [Polychaeton citri CBS 116435]